MRILIPVDGTPECEASIPLAQKLASVLDSQVYLARVVEVRNALSPVRFDPDTVRKMEDAERYLGELASRFELAPDRTRRLVIQSDDAAKEIISIAEREGVDLIIMASHCRGLMQRLTQSSVYQGVLSAKVCPVLSVPLRTQSAGRRQHAGVATRP
jgi:nucleotide-binding universal stress UspA family protein